MASIAFWRFYTTVYTDRVNQRKTGSEATNQSTDSKRKRLDNHQITKPFHQSGVTGFEPATTRPPELNFTFSDKFNELYSSGFYTLSKSCSCHYRELLRFRVFHLCSTHRSPPDQKIEKVNPRHPKMPGIIHSTTDPKFLFQITGLDAHDLSVAHDNQFSILLLRLFNQAFTGKQNPCINFFSCICLISISLIIRNQFIG